MLGEAALDVDYLCWVRNYMMANSHPCAAVERDDISAATDDVRAEAAAQEEDVPTELASASMDEISQANQHNLQEDDAVAELAIGSMNERCDANKHNPQDKDGAAELASASMDEISKANQHNLQEDDTAPELAIASMNERDANKHRPQEEDGAVELASASINGSSYANKRNPQEGAATEPALASMDQSSDVNKHTLQEEDAAADLARASMDNSSDAIKIAHADVVAKGIASVLGPVMNDFDGGVEGALKSQSILASSIDRLTRELDKLLEDVPLPFATQHATRLSGIRKRVLTLNTSLHIIQRRMETIQRFLAGYASKEIAKDHQEKASFLSTENSYSTSLMKVQPTKAMSSSSAEDHHNDDNQLSKVRGSEMSVQFGNIQSGGSQDNNVKVESVSNNLHIEISNQEQVA